MKLRIIRITEGVRLLWVVVLTYSSKMFICSTDYQLLYLLYSTFSTNNSTFSTNNSTYSTNYLPHNYN